MKKFFKIYLPQLFLVVLSVVLGLFLNEWRTEKAEKRKAEQLVQYIKKEIQERHTYSCRI